MGEALVLFINKYLVGAIIAGIGGIAHVLYRVSKGDDFSIPRLIMNMLLAGWIGYVVGEFVPHSDLYNAYVSIAGFCAYPILNLIEIK